jgi:hypothetical protein
MRELIPATLDFLGRTGGVGDVDWRDSWAATRVRCPGKGACWKEFATRRPTFGFGQRDRPTLQQGRGVPVKGYMSGGWVPQGRKATFVWD